MVRFVSCLRHSFTHFLRHHSLFSRNTSQFYHHSSQNTNIIINQKDKKMKSITAFAPSKTSGVSSIHMAAGSLSKPAFAGQSTTSVSALPGWFASHSATCSCANCATHTAGCQCSSCGAHAAGCLCSSCTVGHSFGCHCSACVTAFVQ
jgi:hypothetical protein